MSDDHDPILVDRSKRSHAPSDERCSIAWDQIAALARDHCLILEAAGGVMTIVTPENQRQYNLRRLVLDIHLMQEAESVENVLEKNVPDVLTAEDEELVNLVSD